MGHEDIQTTANIYTHVTNNKKDNTIDKFDRLMSLEGQKDSQSLKTENKKTTDSGPVEKRIRNIYLGG